MSPTANDTRSCCIHTSLSPTFISTLRWCMFLFIGWSSLVSLSHKRSEKDEWGREHLRMDFGLATSLLSIWGMKSYGSSYVFYDCTDLMRSPALRCKLKPSILPQHPMR